MSLINKNSKFNRDDANWIKGSEKHLKLMSFTFYYLLLLRLKIPLYSDTKTVNRTTAVLLNRLLIQQHQFLLKYIKSICQENIPFSFTIHSFKLGKQLIRGLKT